jgi:hypothetical protein
MKPLGFYFLFQVYSFLFCCCLNALQYNWNASECILMSILLYPLLKEYAETI